MLGQRRGKLRQHTAMYVPHRLPANSQKAFCLHGLSEDDKCSCSKRLLQQCHLLARVRFWLLTTNQIKAVLGTAFLCQVLNCTTNLPGLAKYHGPSPAEDVGFYHVECVHNIRLWARCHNHYKAVWCIECLRACRWLTEILFKQKTSASICFLPVILHGWK